MEAARPFPAAPPRRRTQAERSAETRDRVIEAAIDCITEDGFKRATTTRIARRAGVTWGAIQHQFGDKDSILRAVMQRGMERFKAELDTVDKTGPVEQRVRQFTRCAWRYFSHPAYRAFIAITLNMKSGPEPDPLSRETVAYVRNVWSDLFGDLGAPPERMATTVRFTIAVLAGMAIEQLHVPKLDDFEGELEALDASLLRLLCPPDPEG